MKTTIVNKIEDYPSISLENKKNYKRVYFIEKDGTIKEKVFLDIFEPRLREEIILIHYLKFYSQLNTQKLEVNILSRDEPWDFCIEFSNGKKINLEIVSIANNKEQFIINKREERFLEKSYDENIPFHELQKLNTLFPSDKVTSLINKLESEDIDKNDSVKNPYFNDSKSIFLSSLPEAETTLFELIKDAIESKQNKNHSEKESTVIIIDNRASAFSLDELFQVQEDISQKNDEFSFPEIWFYTGYCSNNDGSNSEFSFAPIKCSDIILGKLSKSQ